MQKTPNIDLNKLEDLLVSESTHINSLNEIVLQAIEEEKLLSKKLYEFEDTNPSFGNRIADKVAFWGGSWWFIISFLSFMAIWVITNSYLLTKPFDSYPFIFLNLLLSTIAALQAPIIIMSQNRKEERDRQRGINDYMINLKSEIEIRNMHQKMDLLMSKQMTTLFELQNVEVSMMKEIKDIVNKLHKYDPKN